MGVLNLLLQTRKLEAQAGNGECSGSGPHVEVTSQSLRFFILKRVGGHRISDCGPFLTLSFLMLKFFLYHLSCSCSPPLA